MHQRCRQHAILMPCPFPRIQTPINQPQSLAAGLPEMPPRLRPGLGGRSDHNTRVKQSSDVPGPRRWYTQPHWQWSCSSPQR